MINLPLELSNFLYQITTNKETFMGSDGMVNGKPAFMTELEVGGKKFTVYITD